jgi:hypothetical protein
MENRLQIQLKRGEADCGATQVSAMSKVEYIFGSFIKTIILIWFQLYNIANL